MITQHSDLRPYSALWAKSRSLPEAQPALVAHPLLWHLLDVAAVASALALTMPALLPLAERFGTDRSTVGRAMAFLAALHDIGKANWKFQAKQPELWPGHAFPEFGHLPFDAIEKSTEKHGAVTAAYLWEVDGQQGALAKNLKSVFPTLGRRARTTLAFVIGGHHGEPLVQTLSIPDAANPASAKNAPFIAAALEMAAVITTLIDPPALAWPEDDHEIFLSRFGWALSALLPTADWIASNEQWFPPVSPMVEPANYWTEARERAAAAIKRAGLLPALIAPAVPERTLTNLISDASIRLTPLQKEGFAASLAPSGPTLAIIEDATGAGKTEAALTLAHRLMAAGQADGLYFGLPTMATANAMYGRLAASYRALFSELTQPSLVLAHGKANKDTAFLASLAGNLETDVEAVSAHCAGWIADDRRKALMAQAGAGTIDQALMAALPVRYQSLRLFGLQSKVLILDEIHAYDSFMLAEIEALLTLHAMLGGSAILLSATLPVATRGKLLAAFASGAGLAKPTPRSTAYPLLSLCDGDGLREIALPLAERSARCVAAERLDSVEAAEALALRLASQGAAVALIRSTVDAAIESHQRLAESLPGRVELFHARFLFQERMAIETDVLERFGKAGSAETRCGRVLVATQVIEQSLDLDFDALITDVAPIELLIQRAGRLWRHQRTGRPIAEPILHVITPHPRDDAGIDWLDAAVQEARWVYRDPALLWLSAKRLFDAGAIETSTLLEGEEGAAAHVRQLVEAVHSGEGLPNNTLQDAWGRAEGDGYGKENLARLQVLKARDGYVRNGTAWESEARAVTRLEDGPRVVLRLGREENGRIAPLGEDWSLSEISVSERFAKDAPERDEAATKRLSPPWAKADEGKRLLLMERDGEGWRAAGDAFRYDAWRGLTRCQN
jgi:CRISPR-associated endonuclease/helicase Cas3